MTECAKLSGANLGTPPIRTVEHPCGEDILRVAGKYMEHVSARICLPTLIANSDGQAWAVEVPACDDDLESPLYETGFGQPDLVRIWTNFGKAARGSDPSGRPMKVARPFSKVFSGCAAARAVA